MRKQMIIFGISIIFIVLLFSGCFGNDSEKEFNKFIGTWKHGTLLEGGIIKFFSNGNLEYKQDIGEWKIKDGVLTIYLYKPYGTQSFDYRLMHDSHGVHGPIHKRMWAQYSLPFAVAAMVISGRLGQKELSNNALQDSAALRLSDCVELIEDQHLSARFPAKRFARVAIETNTGDIYDSGEVEAIWDAETAPTDMELRQKFRWLTQEILTDKRAGELEKTVWHCDELPNAASLLPMLTAPVHSV